MRTNRETLAAQLKTCENRLKSLSSYVEELKTMTAKHSTPKEHYDSDLTEATHNIGFYEGEIARIEKEMGTGAKVGGPGTVAGTLLPKTRNQGIGAVIFSSIGFAVGTLLGSRLRSGKSNRDRQSGN